MNHILAKKKSKILVYLAGKVYKFKRYKGHKKQAFDLCKDKCAVKYCGKKCTQVLMDHCDGGYFKEIKVK